MVIDRNNPMTPARTFCACRACVEVEEHPQSSHTTPREAVQGRSGLSARREGHDIPSPSVGGVPGPRHTDEAKAGESARQNAGDSMPPRRSSPGGKRAVMVWPADRSGSANDYDPAWGREQE